jgi:hypothetical protein
MVGRRRVNRCDENGGCFIDGAIFVMVEMSGQKWMLPVSQKVLASLNPIFFGLRAHAPPSAIFA